MLLARILPDPIVMASGTTSESLDVERSKHADTSAASPPFGPNPRNSHQRRPGGRPTAATISTTCSIEDDQTRVKQYMTPACPSFHPQYFGPSVCMEHEQELCCGDEGLAVTFSPGFGDFQAFQA